MSIWTTNSTTMTCFWFTQARWQVAGQLQFHSLSRLNLFIPCVCAFTYLSSSIKITANTSSSSHSDECLQIMHVSTSIYRNTRSISGRTRILGTRVRQTRGKWYIDTQIQLFHARGPLSWSMWGSLRLTPIIQYYHLSSFMLLCYLHEPLAVKTVELHELLLCARWPPQAVHLWPWSYTRMLVQEVLHELTLVQRFSVFISPLISSVSTNKHGHSKMP